MFIQEGFCRIEYPVLTAYPSAIMQRIYPEIMILIHNYVDCVPIKWSFKNGPYPKALPYSDCTYGTRLPLDFRFEWFIYK